MPVTVALMAASCLVYFLFGKGAFLAHGAGMAEQFGLALVNIFRHGSPGHLAGNMLMLGIAGGIVERAEPRRTYLRLILLSALGATALEFVMTDRPFVGISGFIFGIMAYALVGGGSVRIPWIWVVLIVFGLAIDIIFAQETLAVYAHAGGATTGMGLAMFNKLFGQKGPKLVPMGPEHHAYAIAIIAETDEDDAEEAEEQFREEGYDGMFALMEGGRMLGLTGAHLAENSEDVAWLSWTYLAGDARGEGLGQIMLDGLLGKLNEHDVRKIFIATSDYAEDGEEIYADAMDFYRSLGAVEEMRVPDYHADGETKIVFGLDNPGVTGEPAADMDDLDGVRFTGLSRASETEDAFGLDWDLSGTGVVGLEESLAEARHRGGRMVFVALPSDASEIAADALRAAGFACPGRLADYHGVGIDDVWWSKRIN